MDFQAMINSPAGVHAKVVGCLQVAAESFHLDAL